MTALDGTSKLTNILFVMIAQSSVTLFPHILAGCDPCGGVQHVRGSSLENLLHIVLHRRVTEATGKCQGTPAKLFPAPSLLIPVLCPSLPQTSHSPLSIRPPSSLPCFLQPSLPLFLTSISVLSPALPPSPSALPPSTLSSSSPSSLPSSLSSSLAQTLPR